MLNVEKIVDTRIPILLNEKDFIKFMLNFDIDFDSCAGFLFRRYRTVGSFSVFLLISDPSRDQVCFATWMGNFSAVL
jgi:hypothetical protein